MSRDLEPSFRRLAELDPEAFDIIATAAAKAADADSSEAATRAVEECREALASLRARRAAEDAAQ